jgi:hypothetical protein
VNIAFYSLEWSDTARDFKGLALDYDAMAAIGTTASGEEVNLWINSVTLGLLGLGVIFVWHSARGDNVH